MVMMYLRQYVQDSLHSLRFASVMNVFYAINNENSWLPCKQRKTYDESLSHYRSNNISHITKHDSSTSLQKVLKRKDK